MSSSPPAFVAESPPIVHDAYRVAATAHGGQLRKGGDRPYIEHPLRVAALLRGAGFGPEVIAAALLHDVVEDTEMTVEDVANAFGERVAQLVEALTEDKEIEPYARRKHGHRAKVEAAGGEALAIYAADKLANVRDLRAAYAAHGEAVASRFKAPLDLRIRLWEDDIGMLKRLAPDLPFLGELAGEVRGLKAARAPARGAVHSS
jgi:guanosine-3',5'-bis(diphosphate) 3'-pyrophosphohydrolase